MAVTAMRGSGYRLHPGWVRVREHQCLAVLREISHLQDTRLFRVDGALELVSLPESGLVILVTVVMALQDATTPSHIPMVFLPALASRASPLTIWDSSQTSRPCSRSIRPFGGPVT